MSDKLKKIQSVWNYMDFGDRHTSHSRSVSDLHEDLPSSTLRQSAEEAKGYGESQRIQSKYRNRNDYGSRKYQSSNNSARSSLRTDEEENLHSRKAKPHHGNRRYDSKSSRKSVSVANFEQCSSLTASDELTDELDGTYKKSHRSDLPYRNKKSSNYESDRNLYAKPSKNEQRYSRVPLQNKSFSKTAKNVQYREENYNQSSTQCKERKTFEKEKSEENTELKPRTSHRMPMVMNYHKLQQLVSKEPSEILLTICNPDSGFLQLLKKDEISHNMVALIIIALGKSCRSDCRNNIVNVINEVSQIKTFMFYCLQRFLISFQNSENEGVRLESLQYLLEFLYCFQQMLPTSASECVSIIVPTLRLSCRKAFVENRGMYDKLQKQLDEIEEQNNLFIKNHTAEEIKKSTKAEKTHNKTPPENYRVIPILPNEQDIKNHVPFLRPIIINGKYKDVEHYLDVQYRLLREDFVRPLREGIAEYLRLKSQKKAVKFHSDVRCYENVHILKQGFTDFGVVYLMQFNIDEFRAINWERSKRFLTGSLLCLTSDNFDTMWFATVAKRECENLKKGLVFIKLENEKLFNINPLQSFTAVETDAYFEAYRHNLLALQQIKDDFPLKKYIVEVQSVIDKPEYLDCYTTYDMRPLLFDLNHCPFKCSAEIYDSLLNEKEYDFPSSMPTHLKSVQILKEEQWPTRKELNLDDSQYEALKAAITKEFVVIQGPPGTGKTYIGLRILQLLLHNVSRWNYAARSRSPVLVVCYTNHALDQFLEGTLSFTNKIVRIGGRSKNDSLEDYQLNNLRRSIHDERSVPKHIYNAICQKRSHINGLKKDINIIQSDIEKYFKIIVNEDVLRKYMGEEQYFSLKNSSSENFDYMTEEENEEKCIIKLWLNVYLKNGHYDDTSQEVFKNRDFSKLKQQNDSSVNVKNSRESEIIAKQTNTSNIKIDDICKNTEQASSNKVVDISLNVLQGKNELDVEEEAEADIEYIEEQRIIDNDDFLNFDFSTESNVRNEQQGSEKNLGGWKIQGGERIIKEYIYKKLTDDNIMSESEIEKVKNVWHLSIDNRWRLYRYWIYMLINDNQNVCLDIQSEIDKNIQELAEFRKEEDCFILRKADIIGMTTTGAAKYRHIIQSLNPRILIVEEAAEILESHIVTSLAQDTKHLILIGDHQQLQPSPTVYELAVKYNLNISLFERMVKNGMQCFKLKVQHRMRPNIAALLVPHIYSSLENDISVEKYENIKGITKNVFFVSHSYMERQEFDSKSKVNRHEAVFIIELCRYLLLQGYEPSQITILTTYSGQFFELKKLAKSKIFNGVRITVVDNFQGEENDIILTSFVRSNEEGNIGFLKVSNRVCVALSRAKKGLYCIGNFNLLAEKCELWKNILNVLETQQAIGSSLQLICQNHPDVITNVCSDKDFKNVPEGGCTRICEYRLNCGHVCSRICHPYDRLHENVICMKPCQRTCEKGHPCTKKCSVKCGPCEVKVKTIMPLCKHEILISCHIDSNDFCCTALCEKLLKCKHRCQNKCGEPCTNPCRKKVKINLLCGHEKNVDCYESPYPEKFLKNCGEPCKSVLQCGHMCKGNCGKCQQGRLHVLCKSSCNRVLVCGHECKAPCAKNCPPCNKKCENRCVHSKCPSKCNKLCQPCNEECSWSCDHIKCKNLCSEFCDRKPCGRPCGKLLKCKHPCIGLCGEPCPKLCAVCNEDKVKEIFFGMEDDDDARFIILEDCRHVFEVQGLTSWMEKPDDEIQMKVCPKCKTVIRRNLRFGNIIKSCLAKIETVKKSIIGDPKINYEKQQKLLTKAMSYEHTDLLFDVVIAVLKNDKLSKPEVIRNENILEIIIKLTEIKKKFKLHCASLYLTAASPFFFTTLSRDSSSQISLLNPYLVKLKEFINQTFDFLSEFLKNNHSLSSEHQFGDIFWEIQRLKSAIKFLKFIKGHIKEQALKDSAITCCTNIIKVLTSYSPFHVKQEEELNKMFDELSRLYGTSVINVTEEEKNLILKAMNLAQGHWYQCPNGHVYCITECGGAMQLGKCNECGVDIGGQSHTLLSNNRVATDMDGSLHAAWSQHYDNMRNYDL